MKSSEALGSEQGLLCAIAETVTGVGMHSESFTMGLEV